MKICVAQTNSVKGDISGNISNHKKLIDLAAFQKANVIIFPELSLTGYEPTIAKECATTLDDPRFNDFQQISDSGKIVIGVGVPTKDSAGINITMVLFQPNEARRSYSKKYLHADEEAFFVSGKNFATLKVGTINIGLAICYEISIPDHSENASKHGARIYIASVAKVIRNVDKAFDTLSGIASKYGMTVLMSNCIGQCEDGECAGKSSIWNDEGLLIGQLDDVHEGILMIDTNTKEVIEKTI